jgi:hypothetical protein
MRQHLLTNIFVGLDSGHDKAVIPWGKIGLKQEDFIDNQFLPFKFEIRRDPSKMNKTQVLGLLEYWYKRQHNSRVTTPFRFKAYRDRRTGDIVDCDRKGKGRAGNKKGRRKAEPSKTNAEVSKKKHTTPSSESDKEDEQHSHTESDPNTDSDRESEDDSDSGDELPLAGPSNSKVNGKMRNADNKKDKKKVLSGSEEDADSEEEKKVKRAAEARKKKLEAAKQKAMEVARAKRSAKKKEEDMEKEEDTEQDDDGLSKKTSAGNKRKERSGEVNSEGLDDDDDKETVKRRKVAITARKIVTRSQGREQMEKSTGERRSKRGQQ